MSTQDRGELEGELLDELVSRRSQLEGERAESRNRLHEILRESDRLRLLSQAALAYHLRHSDPFGRGVGDWLPAHIEYLAIQAGAIGFTADVEVDPTQGYLVDYDLMSRADEAMNLVRDIFDQSRRLLATGSLEEIRHADAFASVSDEFQFLSLTSAMKVWWSNSPLHLERIILGCFDPVEEHCRELLGFSVREALRIIDTVSELWADRAAGKADDIEKERRSLMKAVKRRRRKTGKKSKSMAGDTVIELLADLRPKQAREEATRMAIAVVFSDACAMAGVTALELSDAARVDLNSVTAFLDAFTSDESGYAGNVHAYPYDHSILALTPIHRAGNRYVMSATAMCRWALRPRMEALLAADGEVWERYLELSGAFVENEATGILARALPGSRSWNGLTWASGTTRGELDGLVASDDVAFRVQAKSARTSRSARLVPRELSPEGLIGQIDEASEQHRALAEALGRTDRGISGLVPEIHAALALPIQIEATVTLDRIVPWSHEYQKLCEAASSDLTGRMPWIVSLLELMEVCEAFSGAEFLDYLLRRLNPAACPTAGVMDEVEWLSNYIIHGLKFESNVTAEDSPEATTPSTHEEDI